MGSDTVKRAWQLLLKWEALKLSFALGAIVGMVVMAVVLTSAKAMVMLAGMAS